MNLEAAQEVARAGRLYPSVILHGADPERRRESAELLARTLLCEQAPEHRPCGDCSHCRRIGAGGDLFHPDVQVLEQDLKTVTSVEATKAFLRGAQVSPFEARGQVFVVAAAESLSGEAANALLKTLEEPAIRSPRNFFLLAPSRLDLLPTLRSRSLAIFLGGGSRPSDDELDALTAELGRVLEVYRDTERRAELYAAAAVLNRCGNWRQGGAEPWERAAAVATDCAATVPDTREKRALLDLAQDLLDAPPLRARGVAAERIIEGFVHQRLAGG